MKNRLLHLLMALVMLLTYLTVPTALADDTVTVTLNVTNTPKRKASSWFGSRTRLMPTAIRL